MKIIFIKIIPIILCSLTLLLDYFRKRDYKQDIPIILNLFFYLFIIFPFGLDLLNFFTSFVNVNSFNYNLLEPLSRFITKALYTYLAILIWYDNMDGLKIKNYKIFNYLLKLFIIFIVGIAIGNLEFTYSFNLPK